MKATDKNALTYHRTKAAEMREEDPEGKLHHHFKNHEYVFKEHLSVVEAAIR